MNQWIKDLLVKPSKSVFYNKLVKIMLLLEVRSSKISLKCWNHLLLVKPSKSVKWYLNWYGICKMIPTPANKDKPPCSIRFRESAVSLMKVIRYRDLYRRIEGKVRWPITYRSLDNNCLNCISKCIKRDLLVKYCKMAISWYLVKIMLLLEVRSSKISLKCWNHLLLVKPRV